MNADISLSYREIKRIYLMFEEADGDIDQGFAETLSKLRPDHVEAVAKEFLVIPNISRSLKMAEKHFDASEIEALIDFGGYAQTLEIVFNLVDSSLSDGCATIRSPISGGVVSSDTSVFCGGVNFLRFKVKGEVVYLIQHDLAAEAIFFPVRGVAVGFGNFQSPHGKLKRLLTELFKYSRKYFDYFLGDRSWGGVYAGSRSPYHYFYFDIPVLFCLDRRLRGSIERVYSLVKEMYIDPVGALSLNSELRLFQDAASLGSDLRRNNEYIFLVGTKMESWSHLVEYDAFNSRIIDYTNQSSLPFVLDKRRDSFTIWLGVSGGKRVWVEEIEALRELVLQLCYSYGHVNVIVDGWTDVEHTSEMPALYDGDQDRAERLISELPSSVSVKNLVGANACQKIKQAMAADFFVASHGTASLFVSRICSVPGVTHISNAARCHALKSHVHPRAMLVPESLVCDVRNGDEITGYHVSYSIHVDDLLPFVKEALFKIRSPS